MTDPAEAPAARRSSDPFVRYEARVLDPAVAVRLPGGPAPTGTVYRGDVLLVTADSQEGAAARTAALAALAAGLDLRPREPDAFTEIDGRDQQAPDTVAHNRRARVLGLAAAAGIPLVVPVTFESTLDGPAPAVDVWPLLQAVRASGDDDLIGSVGLDHLMFSAVTSDPYIRGTAAISGNPYIRGTVSIAGNPYIRGTASGVDQYLQGGSGGHGPVSVVLAPPLAAEGRCRPRVVVLDTGIGQHPWFTAQPAESSITLPNGDPVGMDPNDADAIATDPEAAGAVPDGMTGLLSTHAGHGTFIAGLLRQTCPEAQISALRIMDGDGVVAEGELDTALTGLAVALQDTPIDALVLSLGYYAETDDDATYTAGLEVLLLHLAERGVTTFAAAGNDCTERRSYPAAFADRPAFGNPAVSPLVSVAALNPDGSVALFSNDGPWVTGEAAGANVVSTAPVLASGAWSADTSLSGPGGRPRGTIDPDQFSSGFATWSGTSFAAPVLAGTYLAALVQEKCPSDPAERRKLVPARSSGKHENVTTVDTASAPADSAVAS